VGSAVEPDPASAEDEERQHSDVGDRSAQVQGHYGAESGGQGQAPAGEVSGIDRCRADAPGGQAVGGGGGELDEDRFAHRQSYTGCRPGSYGCGDVVQSGQDTHDGCELPAQPDYVVADQAA
jgi:hypothetical protein